jgi:hypothetical protein
MPIIVRLLVVGALTLISGQVNAASINDIFNDPRAYVDHTVTIEGDVTGLLSLFVFKYFTVNDGTGKINVITERPLPRHGQRIKVTGKIHELFAFGRETLLVLIEEKEEGGPKAERTQQLNARWQHLPSCCVKTMGRFFDDTGSMITQIFDELGIVVQNMAQQQVLDGQGRISPHTVVIGPLKFSHRLPEPEDEKRMNERVLLRTGETALRKKPFLMREVVDDIIYDDIQDALDICFIPPIDEGAVKLVYQSDEVLMLCINLRICRTERTGPFDLPGRNIRDTPPICH